MGKGRDGTMDWFWNGFAFDLFVNHKKEEGTGMLGEGGRGNGKNCFSKPRPPRKERVVCLRKTERERGGVGTAKTTFSHPAIWFSLIDL